MKSNYGSKYLMCIVCVIISLTSFGEGKSSKEFKTLVPEYFDQFKDGDYRFSLGSYFNSDVPVFTSFYFVPDKYPQFEDEVIGESHNLKLSKDINGYFYRKETKDCIRVNQKGKKLTSYFVTSCPDNVVKDATYLRTFDTLEELVSELKKCGRSEKYKECIHYFFPPETNYHKQTSSIIAQRLFIKEYILTRDRLDKLLDYLDKQKLDGQDGTFNFGFDIGNKEYGGAFMRSFKHGRKWIVYSFDVRSNETSF